MLKLLKKEKINTISRLSVEAYRNHENFELTIPDCSVVLHGSNGVGKTSILEAISTFSRSRGGLRNAKLAEMVKSDKNTFYINIELNLDNLVKLEIQSSYDKEKKIRKININGKETNALALIKKNIPMLWMAPHTERIFTGGGSARRSFIDNLVANFDDEHLKRLNEYEKLLKQRTKLLKENSSDLNWLEVLEDMMSKISVSICSSRLDLAFRLEPYLNKPLENFPNLIIDFQDCLEKELLNQPAIDIEQKLKENYHASRKIDSILGGSQHGAQKSDFIITNTDKKVTAKMSSSGEQKAILIAIIIACSRAIRKSKNCPPIILLDDVFSHLDKIRKTSLLAELADLGSQSWITIAEKERFLHNNEDFCYYSL